MWCLARPWDWAPPWSLGLALGLFAGAVLVTALRWRELRWLPDRARPVAVVVGTLGAAWFGAMVAFAGWVLVLARG